MNIKNHFKVAKTAEVNKCKCVCVFQLKIQKKIDSTPMPQKSNGQKCSHDWRTQNLK